MEETGTLLEPSHSQTAPPSPAKQIDTNVNWTTNLTSYVRYFAAKLDQAYITISKHSALSEIDNAGLSDVWNFARKHIELQLRSGGNGNHDDQLLHSNALIALSRMVKAGHILAIFGITTFAYLDVREGPFGTWERHLRGARALLDTHCRSSTELKGVCDRTPGLQQAVALLNWYDVMGLIVHQDRDLIFEDWHREHMDDSLFDLVGCSRETFQLYVSIANHQIGRNTQQSYRMAILQLLKVANRSTDEGSLLRDGWRLGAVLAAVSSLNDDDYGDDIAGLIAEKICDVAEQVDQTHGTYVHFALTVYLTGIYGTRARHQNMVRRYWAYFNSCQNPQYPHAQEMCDKARAKRICNDTAE